ncbi:hypothetical protein CDD81_4803 [Ophiocordyceps australis]|uniref:Conserved oligomeric Golgi complex subunit 8 n=1 Tax=Ophiocordyceps australis TaxID=1399860 RepID=A0A2C5XUU1_9HYPO|nr:hypothetical protein CDD81_4803 [Ophiocordyceps australis]
MADALDELLAPGQPAEIQEYLSHLAELRVDQLRSEEPQRLAQASQSLLLSIQALSKRSHGPIIDSASRHSELRHDLPTLSHKISELRQAVPRLDRAVDDFCNSVTSSSESDLIVRRKQALRFLHNVDRLVNVMELPSLLASAVQAKPVNYSAALDLHAHVRRLASLHPHSLLVSAILTESDTALGHMAVDLVTVLKTPGLKLAVGLRTVALLRRLVPTLLSHSTNDTLPTLFLVCRLTTLLKTLAALEPLRELADEERLRQTRHFIKDGNLNRVIQREHDAWSRGQQTERYLRRYIEIFREHGFAIISMSKSIEASFASDSPFKDDHLHQDPLAPSPPALSAFPLHLVLLLLETLNTYLPIVQDRTSRDSILTQVLYCAGSLGRLGADFGMLLASIGVDDWVQLVKRHRLLAGRLESVIGEHRSHDQHQSAPTTGASASTIASVS